MLSRRENEDLKPACSLCPFLELAECVECPGGPSSRQGLEDNQGPVSEDGDVEEGASPWPDRWSKLSRSWGLLLEIGSV